MKSHLVSILLFFLGLTFGETAITGLTENTFLYFEGFHFNGVPVLSENSKIYIRFFHIALITFIAFAGIRVFDALITSPTITLRREFEIRYKYEKEKFPNNPKISDLERILNYFKNSLEHHLNTSKISVSILVVCKVPADGTERLKLRQVYTISPDGNCSVPSYPVIFDIGEGFAGLAWKFKQRRMGERKFLGVFKNSAYMKLDQQDQKEKNSFLCIPLLHYRDGPVYAVISIDSPDVNTFSQFSKLFRSSKQLSSDMAGILGKYIFQLYFKEINDSDKIISGADLNGND